MCASESIKIQITYSENFLITPKNSKKHDIKKYTGVNRKNDPFTGRSTRDTLYILFWR